MSEKKLEHSKMEIQIDVPQDRVESEYQTVFNKLKNLVKIDGFRKGKAPLNLVESRFREQADREVAENLLQSTFMDAVTEKQLSPISYPRYDFDAIAREKIFSYKAVFDVPPTVDLGKYRDIAAEEFSGVIGDADVVQEIDSMRERFATFTPRDAGAVVVKGDLAKIRVKRVDDVAVDEREKVESKEYSIVVGKSTDESALDKSIEGMKIGEEKSVDVKYPKDYYIKDLAGQKVRYLVHVDEISIVGLPALDDEFAARFGNTSVDDLRVKTREHLDKFVAEKGKGEAKAQVLRTIVESSTFDLPESMVLNEMGSIFRKTQERVGYYAENIDDFAKALGMEADAFREKLRLEAAQSLKVTLSLMEIAKKESLVVDQERYREIIDNLAKRNGKTYEEMEKLVEERNARENIESELLLDSAMDFIYTNAKIKKHKPIPLQEFVKRF